MLDSQLPLTDPPNFKLNNGREIPSVALGTFNMGSLENVINSIHTAFKLGYRHIDTADYYRQEENVGKALKLAFEQGLVKREEVFVTTKVWNSNHRYVAESLGQSLKKLQLDYVDLLLIHWPIAFKHVYDENNNQITAPTKEHLEKYDIYDYDWNFVQTWHQFEEVYKTGKVKSIGVSNFTRKKLDILLAHSKITPQVNQIQVNPYNPQLELVEYSLKHNIVPEAYSPFGSLDVAILEDNDLKKYAEEKGSTPGSLVVSWLVARNIVAIYKSKTPERLESNFEVKKLPKEDIEWLNHFADRKFGSGGRTDSQHWVPPGLFDDKDLDKYNFENLD